MLSNWTQPWGVDLSAFNYLNPVEGTESKIKEQFEIANTMVESLCRYMDMKIWHDATAAMAHSCQSATEAWTALFAMPLANETSAATAEEIDSLNAENKAFSERIASYKKEVARLKRANTLHKKAIDQQKEQEIEQRKTIAAKDKEVVALKKAIDRYKEQEVEQRKTMTAKDKEVVALKKAIDQYKEQEVEQRKAMAAKDKEVVALKKEVGKKPAPAKIKI